jgi:CheY-like chemotaxis protein
MSREVMGRIFEPFFTTKLAGTGTGLGLAFVQKIIARSQGHIRVESEPGVGTTFEILLPQSSRTPAPNESAEKELMPGHREQILLVDDEIPVLCMMQQRLRQLGYRVTTRADSLAALETFRAEPHRYDLVITDNTMPGLQGVELAERIGTICPEVPVILITGLNQVPDFGASRFSALRAVFQKPLDFPALSRRLRTLIDHSTAETQHLRRDEIPVEINKFKTVPRSERGIFPCSDAASIAAVN